MSEHLFTYALCYKKNSLIPSSHADTHIELYNEGYWEPALALKKELAEKKFLKANPWDDEFQKAMSHLWHHEGRRMRHGAQWVFPITPIGMVCSRHSRIFMS